MADYDVVFVGFPNWWSTMPMAYFTFPESHDLTGKTFIPFCTHEGSYLGRSERDLQALCPNSQLLKGLVLRGASDGSIRTRGDEGDVVAWLAKLGFDVWGTRQCTQCTSPVCGLPRFWPRGFCPPFGLCQVTQPNRSPPMTNSAPLAKISVLVDDQEFVDELIDTPISRNLLSRLPLTLTMTRYGLRQTRRGAVGQGSTGGSL
ncbi:flavodoxin [Breoghania sp.]|uniref:flavodoxin n=1 Tax=Breoghania sp. TaxID=2065378 RepID=UPI003204CB09